MSEGLSREEVRFGISSPSRNAPMDGEKSLRERRSVFQLPKFGFLVNFYNIFNTLAQFHFGKCIVNDMCMCELAK
ncbi:hypothetical protein Scep_009939 [Stephania cephalantha]|uniref:Uncharacterized protein n=1 Tax=Stephania cephalantha TaxID=152367 RepID=A0AAP0PCX3_9MAGN